MGDGIVRSFQYAKFRDDKPASPGYSPELVNIEIDPKYYDDLTAMPYNYPKRETMLEAFTENARLYPNEEFLGTRKQTVNEKGETEFGEYEWLTNAELNERVKKIARGMMKLDLCPEVDGEGAKWRFCGIWAKNRWEWTATQLACMYYRITTVGLCDAMGEKQVQYILDQTEMSTIFLSAAHIGKVITYKKDFGGIGAYNSRYIHNLLLNDEVS